MIYDPIPHNRCTRCGAFKPWTAQYFKYVKARDELANPCRDCLRELAHIRYREKVDEIKAYQKQYAAEHSEKISEKKHANYVKNREKTVEANKQYRNQPDTRIRRRITEQRREARKHGALATFTQNDWNYALDYFNDCCAVCGRPRGLWHTIAQDHWIPTVCGGTYTPDNIVPLCHGIDGCNNRKHKNMPHVWLSRQFGKRKAREIEKRILRFFSTVRR